MSISPNLIKWYAKFWLILTILDLLFVVILNINSPPAGPEANLSSAFLFLGLLVILFMAGVARVALRTNRKWLQIITVIMLGFNPMLFFLPIPNSFIVVDILMPVNVIVMCLVLYSLSRKTTHPELR